MFFRSTFIRAWAIPACLVWGLAELIALQRARVARQRLRFPVKHSNQLPG